MAKDKIDIPIPLERVLVTCVKDIDFKSILRDYEATFSGHRIRLTTNYNLLGQFDIVFSRKDIPHLMGWNKVRNKNKSASKIIRDIESDDWTVNDAIKNGEWYKVKNRMLNYNVMHRIFVDKDIVPMVMTSDMKPNRLKLDIVFVVNKTKESVVLGFRKDKERNFFVPTTLHTEKLNNQYNCRRRTKVKKLEWID